jgi:hypothetical protein
MSSLLAADRYQSAVPVLPTEVVRGWRFTATCRARPGLLVGSTPCFSVAWPLQVDVLLEVDRGVQVPIQDQAAVLAGENRSRKLSLGFTVPQPEQVLEEGNHRPAMRSSTTTVP